mmetsp:Transcript_3778/g.23825  ORF Transcript_3778/g.23825 Transcript_3778/m.23825 type:complete len:521 (-) Transcript_3778:73-1635(-)
MRSCLVHATCGRRSMHLCRTLVRTLLGNECRVVWPPLLHTPPRPAVLPRNCPPPRRTDPRAVFRMRATVSAALARTPIHVCLRRPRKARGPVLHPRSRTVLAFPAGTGSWRRDGCFVPTVPGTDRTLHAPRRKRWSRGDGAARAPGTVPTLEPCASRLGFAAPNTKGWTARCRSWDWDVDAARNDGATRTPPRSHRGIPPRAPGEAHATPWPRTRAGLRLPRTPPTRTRPRRRTTRWKTTSLAPSSARRTCIRTSTCVPTHLLACAWAPIPWPVRGDARCRVRRRAHPSEAWRASSWRVGSRGPTGGTSLLSTRRTSTWHPRRTRPACRRSVVRARGGRTSPPRRACSRLVPRRARTRASSPRRRCDAPSPPRGSLPPTRPIRTARSTRTRSDVDAHRTSLRLRVPREAARAGRSTPRRRPPRAATRRPATCAGTPSSRRRLPRVRRTPPSRFRTRPSSFDTTWTNPAPRWSSARDPRGRLSSRLPARNPPCRETRARIPTTCLGWDVHARVVRPAGRAR